MEIHFVTEPVARSRGRTSVKWAIDQLREKVAFGPGDIAFLDVADLNLAVGLTVPSPALRFVPAGNREVCYVALLAPGKHCRAVDAASGKKSKFDINVLNGAVVDYEGHATLDNGSTLRAIEIVPSRVSEPTRRDWRILKAFIAVRGAKHQCYRSLLEGLLPEAISRLPELANIQVLDCSRLCTLEPQLLKQDRYDIQAQDPTLDFSEEKLAQALAKFWVRERNPRHRAA
jgi:hypothetical protein